MHQETPLKAARGQQEISPLMPVRKGSSVTTARITV